MRNHIVYWEHSWLEVGSNKHTHSEFISIHMLLYLKSFYDCVYTQSRHTTITEYQIVVFPEWCEVELPYFKLTHAETFETLELRFRNLLFEMFEKKKGSKFMSGIMYLYVIIKSCLKCLKPTEDSFCWFFFVSVHNCTNTKLWNTFNIAWYLSWWRKTKHTRCITTVIDFVLYVEFCYRNNTNFH